MDNDWDVSICGLNCTVCEIRKAGQGDVEIQKSMVAWFKKELGEDIPPEKIRCDGCSGPLETHWSSNCKMLQCSTEKGYDYCFECPEFVCSKLEAFGGGAPHHKRTIENMKQMKKLGLETWINEQRKKGNPVFCP